MLQNKKYNFRLRIAQLGMNQVRRELFFCFVPMIPVHMKLQVVVAETNKQKKKCSFKGNECSEIGLW
jgi:hypothetical protein